MTNPLASFTGPEVVGLLGRDVSIELINFSRSGCLVESPSVVPTGAFGTLSVEIDGATYTEDVRVARCLSVSGAGERHHIGLEFLAIRRPGTRSLRLYAASLAAEAVGPDGVSLRFAPSSQLSRQ